MLRIMSSVSCGAPAATFATQAECNLNGIR